jgi:hypothetical protein
MMSSGEFARDVQSACDDLYVDPFNPAARERVRVLLGASPGATVLASPREFRRRLLIACDELHDDPADVDAQAALLMLLSGPAPSPVVAA